MEAGAILILNRGVNERITIGSDIVLTIINIRQGQVKIGISAPKSIAVHRWEVAQMIARKQACGLGNPTNPPATEPA